MTRSLLRWLTLVLVSTAVACGGDDGSATSIDARPPGPTELRLSSNSATLQIGEVVYLTPSYFQDGVLTPASGGITWTSSAPAVVAVIGRADGLGEVRGVAPGTATIQAVGEGGLSADAIVTVLPVALAAVVVTTNANSMYVGRTVALRARAVYTDDTTVDVTGQATWSSADPTVMTVDASGTARGVGAGVTTAVASFGGRSGSTELTVEAVTLLSIRIAPLSFTMSNGQARQLTATATFADGSTADYTNVVSWVAGTGASTVVTVSAAGLVTGTAAGSENLYARIGGQTYDVITVTITAAVLTSIVVTPAAATVAVGQARQYTATGVYSDGAMTDLTQQVSWSSSNPAIATVGDDTGSRGLVIGRAEGSATISATGNTSGSTTATVGGTPPLVTSITPTDATDMIDPLTPVAIRFARAMVPASLTAQTAPGPCTGAIQLSRDHFATCVPFAGPPVMSDGNRLATLTPRPALASGTWYRARVLGTVAPVTGTPTGADVVQLGWFTQRASSKCATRIVISQVYAGGGNSGATFTHDFVELHNPGPAPASLDGLAVFLATGIGATWTKQPLPAVVLAPGAYYLVREGSGGAVGAPVVSPDFVPTNPYNLGAASGKVALAPAVNPATAPCAGADALDNVGWGAADCTESVGADPLTATTAIGRKLGGCRDGDLNIADFAVGAPAPRSLATAAAPCACTVNESEGLASVLELDFCDINLPDAVTVATGATTPMIFGRVADGDHTDPPMGNPALRYQLGYGPPTVNPEHEPGFTWVAAPFDGQVPWFFTILANRFRATFVAPAPGSYRLAARVSLDGVNWTYCDADGAGSTYDLSFLPFDFDPLRLRRMTVTP